MAVATGGALPRMVTIEAWSPKRLARALARKAWMADALPGLMQRAKEGETLGLCHFGPGDDPPQVAVERLLAHGRNKVALAYADAEVLHLLAGLGAEFVFGHQGQEPMCSPPLQRLIELVEEDLDCEGYEREGDNDLARVLRILDLVEPARKRRWEKRLHRLADRTEELLRGPLHQPVQELAALLLKRGTVTCDIPDDLLGSVPSVGDRWCR